MSISFSNLVVVQLTISDNCKFYCRSTLVQDIFESPARALPKTLSSGTASQGGCQRILYRGEVEVRVEI